VLFFVREGQLVRREAVPREALSGEALAPLLAGGLAAVPDSDLDADQARILLRWVYRRSGQPECVTVGAGETGETLALRVLEALHSEPRSA
jgi:hypothetical protein